MADSGQAEMRPGQEMTYAQIQEAGEARETWCTVDGRKEADWCRANRKHFKEHLHSTVFDPPKIGDIVRCTWQVNRPTHLQRRHYRTHRKSVTILVACTIQCCYVSLNTDCTNVNVHTSVLHMGIL